MICGSDSGRIVILQYSKEKNCFNKVHQETFGKSGCRCAHTEGRQGRADGSHLGMGLGIAARCCCCCRRRPQLQWLPKQWMQAVLLWCAGRHWLVVTRLCESVCESSAAAPALAAGCHSSRPLRWTSRSAHPCHCLQPSNYPRKWLLPWCRRIVPGEYVAVDPKGRACMVAAVEKSKFVYVLNRDNDARLTISSPLEVRGAAYSTQQLWRWRLAAGLGGKDAHCWLSEAGMPHQLWGVRHCCAAAVPFTPSRAAHPTPRPATARHTRAPRCATTSRAWTWALTTPCLQPLSWTMQRPTRCGTPVCVWLEPPRTKVTLVMLCAAGCVA